ncbi:uncharacterized protein LOC119401877 isoform X1 [Rhipicephalus sanguineus]|uniref:uncharacterized protein LOC119401877 isoform X1 n=1 Tax=Rhipicephalus sanguineus TaxID=34632 RepID=UPI001895F3C4|nr:uncharacterized protein LOC119401877 isoform X1 [Rhipicephalus sanguineus]
MSSFLLRVCLMMTAAGTLTYSRTFKPQTPIGEGITVYARILHDNTTLDSETSDSTEKINKMYKAFEKIFQMVQQKFHNNNVMITINVTKTKDLKLSEVLVPLNGTHGAGLDGRKTLENLVTTQASKSGENGIVYLFTKRSIYTQSLEDDNVPSWQPHLQTRDTFCTENTSAAVVYYTDQQPEEYPFEATALIFGSTRQSHFQKSDFTYMNNSFARCKESVDKQNTAEKNEE